MKRTALASLTAVGLLVPAAFGAPPYREHVGMCDASAAVALSEATFVVASDEDNKLRVYGSGGRMVLQELDMSAFLEVGRKQEADIEGAARMGDRIYWITSHGRSRTGEARPSRRRLFATEVRGTGERGTLLPVGRPYKDLIKDLAGLQGLEGLVPGEEPGRPVAMPAETGLPAGLNIEGLAGTPDGTLLIGLRNPLDRSARAVIVPLKNPAEVVAGGQPRFGRAISLALGRRGIRGIEYVEAVGKYLIIAGPSDDKGEFRLYRWSGPPFEEVEEVKEIDLSGINPETIVVYPGGHEIQILSDDGTRLVKGKACKAASPGQRSFRSMRAP
jgi:hypothetical protein